jgi:hypothetical protein
MNFILDCKLEVTPLVMRGGLEGSDSPRIVMRDKVHEESNPLHVPITPALETVASSDPEQSFSRGEQVDEWTRRLENRFAQLAAKEALGDLNSEEERDLEFLTLWRRVLHHPMDTQEIIWRFRDQKNLQTLLQALANYVSFHEIRRDNPKSD